MRLQAFIQRVEASISQELRDELSWEIDQTASETLSRVSDHCTELYEELGQNLPEWLIDTFDHEQLTAHNLHVNAMRIADSYDRSKAQRFLYTVPVPVRFDKAITLYQYGDADVTVSKGEVHIFDNHSNIKIQTGAAVTLRNCSNAAVDGKAIVETQGSTLLTAEGNPMVKAKDNGYIIVKGDATIDATDYVNIEIQGGSPIIMANKHVRIANRVKQEAGETVRLMIGATVLLAYYSNNGSIISHMEYEKVPHVWGIDAFDPTMGKFIESMRHRYESNSQERGFSYNIVVDPDFGTSKEAILGLMPDMPQTASKDQIQKELSRAASHEELLDTVVAHMDLFVNSGLTHELLDRHFTYIHLTRKGIYTRADFIHHIKPITREVYLFGEEQFQITHEGLSAHAYEHTAILGNNINVDLHDHSLALSLELDKVQLSGHSLAGAERAKTLTMTDHGSAQIGDTDMASLFDSSFLISYRHTDILSLHDKAEAYYLAPPTRVNKESETSQLHYVLSKDNPFVKGTTACITVHEKEADLIAALKAYQAQRMGQKSKKGRGH